MKAWVVRAWGGPDSMELEDVGQGEGGDGLVRVRVEAAALNFFDALLIGGTYQMKPDFPFTPGGEVAGTIVSAPPGSGLNEGQRVMAQAMMDKVGRGGYAEFVDTIPQLAHPIPDTMSMQDAAAFYIVYQTGWFGLHRRAHLQPGGILLGPGGARGPGAA